MPTARRMRSVAPARARGVARSVLVSILATFCLLGHAAARDQRSRDAAAQRPDAQAAAASLIARLQESTGSPAVSGAVVAGPETAWAHGVERRYRIGSVSKLLTATALARMAERGAIDIDLPVQRYVPAFPHAEVTVRQLAGHLGGVRHYQAAEYINRKPYGSIDESLPVFLRDPLVAPPGEKYAYSSYGYNLIGAAMESAAKTSFVEILRSEVFAPFGLSRTTPDSEVTGRDRGGYFSRTDAGQIGPAVAVDLSDRLPSGGLVSTAADLARFLQGVASLPASTRKLLFSSMATADGTPTGVGLGWRLARDASGRAYAHHGGDTVGGRALVLLYPDEGVGVVLLANLSFARITEQDALALAALFLPDPAQ